MAIATASPTSTATPSPTPTPVPSPSIAYAKIQLSIVCDPAVLYAGRAKLTISYSGTPRSAGVLFIDDPAWQSELAAGQSFDKSILTFGTGPGAKPDTIVFATGSPGPPGGIWVSYDPPQVGDPTVAHALIPKC